jgi:hypothetical protein
VWPPHRPGHTHPSQIAMAAARRFSADLMHLALSGLVPAPKKAVGAPPAATVKDPILK